MSIDKVLRSIKDEHADRLADAWLDHDREQQERLTNLGAEINKVGHLSTVSTWVAGLTLAGLVAGSLFVGLELGGLKQSVVTLQEDSKELQAGIKRLEERFTATENLIKGIDERTKRIEDKQQASLNPAGRVTPLLSENVQNPTYAAIEAFKYAPLRFVEFVENPFPVYKTSQVARDLIWKRLSAANVNRDRGFIIEQDQENGAVLIDFGQGDQGWVRKADVKASPLVCLDAQRKLLDANVLLKSLCP